LGYMKFMTPTSIARALSIVGHPGVVMPVAVLVSVVSRGAPNEVARVAFVAALGIAAVVAVYSLLQVRSGRWAHVDASVPTERVHLNLLLAGLLLGAAFILRVSGQPAALVAGVGLSAAIVLVALVSRHWMKLSLHSAFGAYAAALLWPLLLALGILASLAAAVAWSRLQLGRHTATEVAAGLSLGVVAGVAFQLLA
jgi:hypothetical protein